MKTKPITFNIELRRYKNASALICSYFKSKYSTLKNKEILEKYSNYTSFTPGPIKKRKISEFVKEVEDNGYWGFCAIYKDNSRVIHYWTDINKKLDEKTLTNFFSHEMTHAFGYRNEDIACDVGSISQFTKDLIKEYNIKRSY